MEQKISTLSQLVADVSLFLVNKTFDAIQVLKLGREQKSNVSRLRISLTADLESLVQTHISIQDFPVEQYTKILDRLSKLTRMPSRDIASVVASSTSLNQFEKQLDEIGIRGGVLLERWSKVADFVGMAGSVPIIHHTLTKYSPRYAVPLAMAAGLYFWDMFSEKKGRAFGPYNVSAMILGVTPSAMFLVDYLATGNPESFRSAKLYAFLPFQVFLLGNLMPSTQLTYHMSKFYGDVGKGLKSWSAMRATSKFIDRLKYVVSQVEKAKAIQGFPYSVTQEHLDDFVRACSDYMPGNIRRRKIEDAVYYMYADTIGRHTDSSQRSGSSVVQAPTRIKREEEFHLDTYEFLIALNIGDDVAKRVSRSMQMQDVQTIVNQLSSAIPQAYQEVLRANPNVFFTRDNSIYIAELYKLVGTITTRFPNTVPEQYDASRNPVPFSTVEGVKFLRSSLEGRISSDSDGQREEVRWKKSVEEAGYNHNLLHILLTRGFRLGSNRPVIGMAYVDFVDIKGRTLRDKRLDSKTSRRFDNTFGRLISEGAILTDKEYKSGGGRFPSCYSVTPNFSEIRNPAIREYITYLLYSR